MEKIEIKKSLGSLKSILTLHYHKCSLLVKAHLRRPSTLRIINTLKFLAFQEPNPRHTVIYNPSTLEISIWISTTLITSTLITLYFFFNNPIPYITPFGNQTIGTLTSWYTIALIHHITHDKPQNAL